MPMSKNTKFQTVSINVKVASSRKEMFQGREHLVVPIVALVEGVLQGATAPTPELALASEFGKFVQGWNGRPVTLGHPMRDNKFVSASASPKVFEEEALGFLFNSVIEGTSLKTEAWIDLSKVASASAEVQAEMKRLQDGETVEVSTGLFTLVEDVGGKFNNEEFQGVWREIVPDHLAILHKGVKGACSIKDGCGANRNNAQKNVIEFKTNCGCDDEKKKPIDVLIDTVMAQLFKNKKSRVSMNVSEGGMVTLETSETHPNNKEKGMTKEQMIANLIANKATSFEEADKAWLTTLSEDQLKKLEPKVESAEEKAAREAAEAEAKANKEKEEREAAERANAGKDKKPQTVQEYVANAPAEVQEVLNEGIKMHATRKAQLVKDLKANKRNEFSEDELKAMSIPQLERLAKLADLPSYEGRAGGGITAINAENSGVTEAPKVFGKKKEA